MRDRIGITIDDLTRPVAPGDSPGRDRVGADVAAGEVERVKRAFVGRGRATERQRRCDVGDGEKFGCAVGPANGVERGRDRIETVIRVGMRHRRGIAVERLLCTIAPVNQPR